MNHLDFRTVRVGVGVVRSVGRSVGGRVQGVQVYVCGDVFVHVHMRVYSHIWHVLQHCNALLNIRRLSV